jgi:hypothetical protein
MVESTHSRELFSNRSTTASWFPDGFRAGYELSVPLPIRIDPALAAKERTRLLRKLTVPDGCGRATALRAKDRQVMRPALVASGRAAISTNDARAGRSIHLGCSSGR